MAPDRHSDKDLWRLISQDGDRPAFELLYRRTMHALMAAIYKWSGDTNEAEDILQEVFLDLWDKEIVSPYKTIFFPICTVWPATRYSTG